MPTFSARAWTCTALAAILLLTAVVYSPVLSASFVYDDYPYVVDNPLVTSPTLEIGEILNQPFPWRGASQQWYRPLTVLSYRLNAPGGQLSGPAFHRVNLALHLLVVGLVLIWSRQVLRSASAALVATLLFALMPGHAEAVLWISGRSELLAGACCVAALITLGTQSAGTERSWLRSFAPALLLGLGLLAKESAVTLIPIVAAVLITLHGKQVLSRSGRRQTLAIVLPLLLVLVAYLLLRLIVVGQMVPDADESSSASWWQRLALSGRVWWQALISLIYLGKPSVEYYWANALHWTWQSVAGWLVLAGAVVAWLRVRVTAPRLGIAVLLCGFGLYSHLLASTELFAERFLYLPSVGFCLLVGAALEAFAPLLLTVGAGPLRVRHCWLTLLLVTCCLAGGVQTFSYARFWQDDLSLWRYTAKVAPQSPLVWQNLGTALMNNGRPRAAARAFQRALDDPFLDRRARLNLLRAFGRMGDFRSAIALAGDALQRYPDDVEILYLLGRHQILGGYDDAVRHTIATLNRLGEHDPQAADSARRLLDERER